MQGDTRQLFFLKAILNSFAESSGLKVNYAKSMMVPINISEHKLNLLANTFGCSIGSFSFTALFVWTGLAYKPWLKVLLAGLV